MTTVSASSSSFKIILGERAEGKQRRGEKWREHGCRREGRLSGGTFNLA